MKFPVIARLAAKATGEAVAAEIRPTLEYDLLLWLRWSHTEADQDQGWDWQEIFQACETSNGKYECYSILAQGELQGLMALDVQSGQADGVLVDYLATSPGNRSPGAGLRKVGISLIVVALERSLERGMSGKIWLESLSGAEGFYESLGMTKRARRSAEGYSIYVLDASSSADLLRGIKAQGVISYEKTD